MNKEHGRLRPILPFLRHHTNHQTKYPLRTRFDGWYNFHLAFVVVNDGHTKITRSVINSYVTHNECQAKQTELKEKCAKKIQYIVAEAGGECYLVYAL